MRHSLITPLMIEKYAKRLVDRLKHPLLTGVVITGSFARGEAGPHSDLDIWCFYNEALIKSPSLPELTGISLDVREVCLRDFNEVADGSKEYVAPCFEQLKIYGETPFVLPARNEIKIGLMTLLLSIDSRLNQFVSPINPYELLNDLMYILRIERFFATSQYPLTLSELYSIQFEETDRFLVELYSSYLFGHNHQTEDEIRFAVKQFVQNRLSRNSLMERESD
ncbi:nucleotidyltransferase domain-containing protein [Guptibacillus hwajinpoensis]|uniref:nucleotidyltransferase domain-containing protein n=1 Tax=Guptibacillus hwajinpoensis TaxID=208199 RepID=UPI001CFCBB94|nr:nucleotidyltransferase domain-containing protein [Pseudalkalibacillus hwajinpoensis]